MGSNKQAHPLFIPEGKRANPAISTVTHLSMQVHQFSSAHDLGPAGHIHTKANSHYLYFHSLVTALVLRLVSPVCFTVNFSWLRPAQSSLSHVLVGCRNCANKRGVGMGRNNLWALEMRRDAMWRKYITVACV